MKHLKALDLFCGGGGACLGLQEAGFEVTGIDLVYKHKKNYPGRFIQADIKSLPLLDLTAFDLIWASPPCQFASRATPKKYRKFHENLIPLTRNLIRDHPLTIIENVPSGHLRKDVILTGPTVGLNRILRRRYFELSFFPGLIIDDIPLPRDAFGIPWTWKTMQLQSPKIIPVSPIIITEKN